MNGKQRLQSIFLFLLCLITASSAHGKSIVDPKSLTVPSDVTFIGKIQNSTANGFGYAYAPSIVFHDGKFHMFYCSPGTIPEHADAVRYSSSSDGINWSKPYVVMDSQGNEGRDQNRSACDPSVVQFTDSSGVPYFYLFYSGNVFADATVMYVARSTQISGPYATYDHGSWVRPAPNPTAILRPHKSGLCENLDKQQRFTCPIYGAGQQTVVVKDGWMHAWYTEATEEATPADPFHKWIYFTRSNDGINWTSPIRTTLENIASVDVKYHPVDKVFYMIALENEHGLPSAIIRYESIDGVDWNNKTILCDAACTPNNANNVGVSGNAQGHIERDYSIVAYGAPYVLEKHTTDVIQPGGGGGWGEWDLWAHAIRIGRHPFPPTEPLPALSGNLKLKYGNNGTSSCGNWCANNKTPDGIVGTCGFAYRTDTNRVESCWKATGQLLGPPDQLLCGCQDTPIPAVNAQQRYKFGNNGTTSCSNWCANNQTADGVVGSCGFAYRTDKHEIISCAAAVGLIEAPFQLVCGCNESFLKFGNNGTSSCANYCAGAQFGRVGQCVSAQRRDNYSQVSCSASPGLLPGGEQLLCWCQ